MLRYIGTLSLLLVLSSCSSGSLVGRRVDNFTAYYNTFYNAERVFDNAEKSLEVKDPPVDREVYLEVFVTPDRVTNRQDFDNTIKKSADVLREHDNSKWVDDALLLIGKSNFYTQNYSSAERYFFNVIEVSSKLDGEAQAWIGKAYLADGRYEDAITHLTTTLASESVSKKWAPTLKLQLGDAYVRTGNFENAAEMLRAGIAETRDKDQRARASYLLGQVFETLGDSAAAVVAYSDAADHEAMYELSFAGQFKVIELLASSDPEEANRLLRRMERDDKHFANSGQLDYLRGRLYMEQNRWTEARDYLVEMLSEPAQTDRIATGKAHYALGQIYEHHLVNYPNAAAHYDTASTNLDARVSEARANAIRAKIQDPFAPGALTDAGDKAEVFGAFAEAYAEVSRIDSLLELGSLDDAAFEERIQQLRRQRLVELEEQRRRNERRAIEQEFRNSGSGIVRQGNEGSKGAGSETGLATASGQTESGFLHHKDPIQMRTGVQNFIDVWGDRPLVDNWRIESILIQADREELAGEGNPNRPGARDVSLANMEFLPDIDVSDVPRTALQQQQAREERAEARYQVGNVLFLAMNRADSAAHWYSLVVEEDSEFEVSQRAHYALLETTRALGDTAEARRLEHQLLERYPGSEFARRLAEDVNESTSKIDTLGTGVNELARAAYNNALDTWLDGGEHERAYHMMLEFAATEDSTFLTSKALYAATNIYHEWARQNNVDPLAAVQFETPDSLLQALGVEMHNVQVVPADSALANSMIEDSVAVGPEEMEDLDGQADVSDERELVPPRDDVDARAKIADDVSEPGFEKSAAADSSDTSGREGGKDGGMDERPDDKVDGDVVREVELIDDARRIIPAGGKAGESIESEVTDSTMAQVLSTATDGQADSLQQGIMGDIGSPDLAPDSLTQRVYYLADLFELIASKYPESEEAAHVRELVLEREPSDSQEVAEGMAVAEGNERPRKKNDDVFDDEVAARQAAGERSTELNRERPRKPGAAAKPNEPETVSEGEASDETIEFVPEEELSSRPLIIGGPESLKRRIRFPEDQGEHPDGGTVLVEFVVSRDGFVQNPVVVEGLSGGYDEVALQVLREIRFRPAVNKRAQPVPFKMQLEIPFER